MSLPRIEGWGRLGSAPDCTRDERGGQWRANFSLAFNDTYKDRSGREVKLTTWLDCVAWGRTAQEIAAAGLQTGQSIYLVEARLKEERWEDDNGQKRRNYEATVWQFALAGPRVARPPVAEGPGG